MIPKPPFPTPTPLRLPRGKAVTIGIGCLCEQGILLAADTQITFPESHKYYECKIYYHGVAGEWATGFTFAGSPAVMKRFDSEFKRLMESSDKPDLKRDIRNIVEIIETALEFVEYSEITLLCGVAVFGEVKLFRTEGRTVSPVRKYDYIGVGDSSLLRYLCPILWDRAIEHTSKQALCLAVYSILQAKRYIEDCGGDTDVLMIYPECRTAALSSGTYNMEQQLLRLENDISTLCDAALSPLINDALFDQNLDRFCETVKSMRQSLR
jgi:hypothetical protein